MFTVGVAKTCGNGWANTPNIHLSKAWKKMDRPIVTITIEIAGSPIRGRSTTTWTSTPSSDMNTRQTGKPIQNGRLSEATSHQQAHAPISTNSPCAKFTTWLAL